MKSHIAKYCTVNAVEGLIFLSMKNLIFLFFLIFSDLKYYVELMS